MLKNKSVNLTHKLLEELLGGGGNRDGVRDVAVGRICQSDNKIKTLYNTS